MDEVIPIGVDVKKALDTLSGHVFAGPKACLRELIANAADSISALPPESLGNVEIRLDRRLTKGCLSLSDTGVGMDRREAKARLGTIFSSSKRPRGGSIGQFGIGFYSCFPLCTRIEVHTRTRKAVDPGTRVIYDGGSALHFNESTVERPGTTIQLYLRSEYLELLEEKTLRELIARDCDFVPYPIYLGPGYNVLNRLDAPWYHPETSPDLIGNAMRDIFGWGEALAVVPIQRPQSPGTVYGALMAPAQGASVPLRLYSHRVLICEDAAPLLPDGLRSWIGGVIDAEDLPLVLSRDAVLEDAEATQELRRLLEERFVSGLLDLARRNRRELRKVLAHHGRALKEACLAKPTLMARLWEHFEFSSSLRDLVTIPEYLKSAKGADPKVIYVDDHHVGASLMPLYNRANREVLYMTDPEDARLRTAWSGSPQRLIFERLDVDPPAGEEPGVQKTQEPTIGRDRAELIQHLFQTAVEEDLKIEIRDLGAQAPAALLAISDRDRAVLRLADEVRRLAKQGRLDQLPEGIRGAAEAGLLDRLAQNTQQTLILNSSDSVVQELAGLLDHGAGNSRSNDLLLQLGRFLHAQALLGSGRALSQDTLRDIAKHQKTLLTHLLQRIALR